MPIDRFFHHLDALEVQDLSVGFETTIQHEADFPWASKNFGVFNSCVVADRIPGDRCVSFDNMQGSTMEISRPVKPGIGCEAGDIDDQRVSLPVANRVA